MDHIDSEHKQTVKRLTRLSFKITLMVIDYLISILISLFLMLLFLIYDFLVLLTIIGVGILSAFIIILILSEEISAPPNKVWVQRPEHLCSSDPLIEYLETNDIVIYDSKREFKKEFQQMCEACSCRIGIVDSYLISQQDALELDMLWK